MNQHVGIVVHRTQPAALAAAGRCLAWLEQRGARVALEQFAADGLDRPELGTIELESQSLSFIVSLGGDGTILLAARLAAPAGVPILGVHMGRFGFIAEAHPDDVIAHLEPILAGQSSVQERLMLRAEIWRGDQLVHSDFGLNEAQVKSGMSHMLRLNTYLAGTLFATYLADGVILATPTGSTAYALSAGGPLIEPTVEVFLMVPICPHTLSARPLIVPCDETIEIIVEMDRGEALFAMDSAAQFSLSSGDRVVVRRADFVTRLIVGGRGGFYRKVRDRYLYGERLNG